jgi:hypothetical protein
MTRILIICVILLSGFPHAGNAQNPIETPVRALKLYSTFSSSFASTRISSDTMNGVYVNERMNYSSFGRITPAFTIQTKNGNWHEFEISRFEISKRETESTQYDDSTNTTIQLVGGNVNRLVNIRLKYEINNVLLKNLKESKFKPMLGFLLEPYYGRSKNIPKTSLSFLNTYAEIGASLGFVPRVTYNFTHKWFVDINVPINVIETTYSRTKIENPSFTAEQQSSSLIDIVVFPSGGSIRFGVGFII